MSIVVDTSAIISVITNEKHKSQLIKITRGEELIAPESLHWEIGNAFSAMLKRKRIDIKLAKKALKYYQKIPLRFVETDLEESLEIAHNYNIYAYDAYFIECARNYKLPLLTLDNSLFDVAKKVGVSVKEI
jgi:predicted nucleic acid-binding protein